MAHFVKVQPRVLTCPGNRNSTCQSLKYKLCKSGKVRSESIQGYQPSQVTMNDWKFKSNILIHLNAMLYGQSDLFHYHTDEVKKSVLTSYLPKFEIIDRTTFERRITCLSWNQNEPYVVATGDKFGNFLVLKGNFNAEGNSRIFSPIFHLDSEGAGNSILGIKFQTNDTIILAGLNGKVTRVCTEKKEQLIFHDTHDYSQWFTSLDVSNSTNTVVAGDTTGSCYLFTGNGELVSKEKLHKGKVLHCEFNPRIPHLLATSGLSDHMVKLFDLRKFRAENCLSEMHHPKGCNVARFSPRNGSRLLTNDQKDEIRIYEGPLWDHRLTISHPHRQFQHITPIKASWHPLHELVVIGTYPEEKDQLRPIQFFDPANGGLVYEMFSPTNTILNLNEFNILGDYLASGSGQNLLLWGAMNQSESQTTGKGLKNKSVSNSMRNALRGEDSSRDTSTTRRTKRKRSAKPDDEDDDSIDKKKGKGKLKK